MTHVHIERPCSCGATLQLHRNRPVSGDPLEMRGVEVFHGRGEARLHIPIAEELALYRGVSLLDVRPLLARIADWCADVHRYEGAN